MQLVLEGVLGVERLERVTCVPNFHGFRNLDWRCQASNLRVARLQDHREAVVPRHLTRVRLFKRLNVLELKLVARVKQRWWWWFGKIGTHVFVNYWVFLYRACFFDEIIRPA